MKYISQFLIDVFCPEAKLQVEVNHLKLQLEAHARRYEILNEKCERLGYNNSVIKEAPGAVKRLRLIIEEYNRVAPCYNITLIEINKAVEYLRELDAANP